MTVGQVRDDNRVKYGIFIKELGGSSFRWNDKSGGMDRENTAFAGIGSMKKGSVFRFQRRLESPKPPTTHVIPAKAGTFHHILHSYFNLMNLSGFLNNEIGLNSLSMSTLFVSLRT
jgi:hypothetical protein